MSNKGPSIVRQLAGDSSKDNEIKKVSGTDNNSDEKKKKKKPIKGCIFEVCEDLKAFAPTIPNFDVCAQNTGASEYMWLVHDHDVYGEDDLQALKAKGLDMSKYQLGAPKNDHVHVFLHFSNPTTLPKIAKAFNVSKQNVQLWKGATRGANVWGNAISYLTHRTLGAQNKYQYDPSSVHANFDYVGSLDAITKDVEKAEKRLSKNVAKSEFYRLVDLYAQGTMSFRELNRQLSVDPSVMQVAARQRKFLEDLRARRDDAEIELFFKVLKQPQRVVWLYGDTGCGKSLAAKYMAQHFARKRFPDESPIENSYQVLGSSTGTFERYSSAVHCIILDDFRPGKSFKKDDLLRIFEPNKDQPASMPARYHDRKLAAGMIIVTSNIDPAEFYYRSEEKWTAINDELRQLRQSGEGDAWIFRDSKESEYQFDDIYSMTLSPDAGGRTLYRYTRNGAENASQEDIELMRSYYNQHLRGVDSIEVIENLPVNLGHPNHMREEIADMNAVLEGEDPSDFSHMDAIKRAQVVDILHRHKGENTALHLKTIWTRGWTRRKSAIFSWNKIESPATLLRRMTTYHVSRRVDNIVAFKLMHPVDHDNGYCDFEPDADSRLLSLEEVWEGKCFSDLSAYNSYCDDFNDDFHVPSPYNSYCDDFNLDYEDQTLSFESDFMFRCRRTYLYIYGEDRSRYLDRGADPVVKADVEYDQQALDEVLKKVKDQVDMM